MKDTKKTLKNKFLTIGIFMAFVMALCACESKDEPTPNGEAEQQATETAAPAKTTETPASKQTDTPIPTVTPTVAPTATLIPTETPVPKVIPTYTPTPIPTATPTATPTSTPIPTPTPTPEPEQTEIEYINYPVWVAVNGAKMYKEWDTESEQLAELKKGTKLRATRYQIGGWYFVLNGNILGWIEESNVVETDPNK